MKKSSKVLRILIPIAGVIVLLSLVVLIAGLKDQPFKTLATETSTSVPENPTGTQSMSLIDTLQITIVPSKDEIPSSTPTLSITDSRNQVSGGFYIFSMAEDKFFHLFAYNPDFSSPVHLTDADWDDIDPAVSPDGKKIAYGSRQSGFWDIYVLDLVSGSMTQITSSPVYDGHPTWSSDGQWLAFESYVDNNLDIYIQSSSDPLAAPIRLTDDPANDFSPAWGPTPGREIIFVSDRTGDDEIWVARLDQIEDRFVNISQSPESSELDPAYSPDGRYISWTTNVMATDRIVVFNREEEYRHEIGFGSQSTWKQNGAEICSVISEPNCFLLVNYGYPDYFQMSPFVPFDSSIRGIQWISPENAESIRQFTSIQNQNGLTLSTQLQSRNQRQSTEIIQLENVNAPYPFLINSSATAFQELRGQIGNLCGWDFLANLESAYLPISEPTEPGMNGNWLFTGRAIQLNSSPLEAGWMAIAREDFNGQTYWRVFIRALKQDGSQGSPIKMSIWDLDKRYSGQPEAYENGGSYMAPPDGFWIDFTELALRHGWQRVPALSNWRTYYPAARFDLFIHPEGLDLQIAMKDLYPPEALVTFTPYPTSTAVGNPSPTIQKTP